MTPLAIIPLVAALALSRGGTVAPPVEHPRPVLPAPASNHVRGKATWYDYRPGHAAAGPALRKALGKHWRGMTVVVRSSGRQVTVKLSDWCACPGGRVIDLDVRSFARLADPSRGVIKVEVKR
jgi:hypothetical protein